MANGNGNGTSMGARPKVRIQTDFVYPVGPVVLGAGASASAVVRIDSATDFIWIKNSYFATVDPPVGTTEATRIIPNVRVQIQVSGADRNMFQSPIVLPTWFGTGELPFILPAPMVLLANSTLTFDFESFDDRDLDFNLSLAGLKDFGELESPEVL